MGKLIKWLLYLFIIGLSVLIIYAFMGPLIFGVEFEPQQTLISKTTKLNAN
jgi:predicted membrane protein